ncbi:MAG TPA: DEAD/DEAH box helicase, partial [Clostridia bacterium]|nr:DEAD/DEAH box helicase [Clostridia bacterium]
MKFTEFNFSDKVLEGIQKAGFTECMPVQAEVFQHGLNAKQDVTVQSRTGTGKTAAFLLTIFELFTRDPEKEHKALIIAPTRELAVQIEQEAKLLGKDLPYKIG